MTDLKPNAGLAYKVLDHIDAHPEQWEQGVWIGAADCRTSACFAGWACLLAGDVAAYEHPDDDETDVVSVFDGKNPAHDLMVPQRAAELLGIPYGKDSWCGHDLFQTMHDREDLGRLVAEIFGPRPAVTP